jgi:hypothetical protein
VSDYNLRYIGPGIEIITCASNRRKHVKNKSKNKINRTVGPLGGIYVLFLHGLRKNAQMKI